MSTGNDTSSTGSGDQTSLSDGEEEITDEELEESTYSDPSSSPKSPPVSESQRSFTSDEYGPSSKRKLQDAPTPLSRVKRIEKTFYSHAYRELLNETIEEAAGRTVPVEDHYLQSSQIGISYWTAQEKAVLFDHLSLLGKDDIQGLAAAVLTKSEMEIKVYLQLLQDGLVEQNYKDTRYHLLEPYDFPAAHEVSSQCRKALDQAAEALARREDNHSQKMEAEKWQDMWLLTEDVSDWVETCLGEGLAGETEVQEPLPAAVLLKLSSWLELSERIFMNPALPEEGNWRFVTENQPPSIYATAFSDFHTLAVSLTKRLVQATLFCAMSRLRAMDSGTFSNKPLVQRRDVKTAIAVLGLKSDSNIFWIGAARRCRLDVYEKISMRNIKKGLLNPLPYEDIEGRLKAAHVPQESKQSDAENEAADPVKSEVHLQNQNKDTPSLHAKAIISSKRSISSDSGSESGATDISGSSDGEQDYLDALDQKASILEEQRLWAVLNREAPKNIKAGDFNVPKKPTHTRKLKGDLTDWRDRTDFQSEWESFRKPVPSSRWARNQDSKT